MARGERERGDYCLGRVASAAERFRRSLLPAVAVALLTTATIAQAGLPEYPELNPKCGGGYTLVGSNETFKCGMNFTVQEHGKGMLLFTYDPSTNTVRFGLQTPTQGWISLGFQTEEAAASMVGAKAVIGGAGQVQGYSLDGKSIATVVPDKNVTDSLLYSAYQLDPISGITTLEFEVNLTQSIMPIRTEHRTYIIWAVGSSTSIGMHDDCGAGLTAVLDSSVDTVIAEQVVVYDWAKIHGIIMAVSWAVLLPAGAVMARYIPHFGKLMYTLHMAIQVAGITLTLVGVALILCSPDIPIDWFSNYSEEATVHGLVGIVIVILAMLQPLNGFFRPGAGISSQRRSWEISHLVIGKLSLGLAFFNMFFGVYIYAIVNGTGYWAYWAVPMAASLFVIYLTQSVMDKLLHHKAEMKAEEDMAKRIQEGASNKVKV